MLDLQYQYFTQIERLNENIQLNETLHSEIRNYEEENIPTDKRILGKRRMSCDQAIGMRIPKTFEEAEIADI